MYLLKSSTLENSIHVITFNLFIKEGKPILVESVLSNGSKADSTYNGKEDILGHLWRLDLLCNGEIKARRIIHDIHQCLIDYLYA